MKPKPILTVVLTLLATMGSACRSFGQATDVAVVVNAANPITNLSYAELRKIFAGEKHLWPGGIPVRLIVRPPGSHERAALLQLLNKTESEYKQYWMAQVLRGEAANEPFVVPSVGMQKEAIRTFVGAITLVEAKDVQRGTKVIKIEGHLPGESGYPLH